MSGFGLAGFANGLNNGLQLGMRINELRDQHKIAKIREQGIAEAKALQAKAAPQVQDNGDMQNLTANPQASRDPNANPDIMGALGAVPSLAQQAQQQTPPQPTEFARSIPPEQVPLSSMPMSSPVPGAQPEAPGFASGMPELTRKRFSAGDKQFDTKEEADSYAKSQMPDIETFYAKTLVPRMKEQLMSMGRVEDAAKWEKYAEESKAKGDMKTWGRALQFAQGGDYENAATQLMKLYPDYDDGFELVSSKKDKGPNGEDGFTMKVKDSEGNVREVFHDSKTITEVGLAQLSPIEMFQQRLKRQTAAETLAAREAIDRRNDERTFSSRATIEATKEQGRNERQEAKIEATEKRDEKLEAGRNQRQDKALAARIEADAKRLAANLTKGEPPERQYMKALEMVEQGKFAAVQTTEQKDELARALVAQAKKFAADQSGVNSQPTTSAPAGGVANPFGSGEKPKGVPVFRNGKIEYR
jgi:hypothetical protein